MKHARHDQLARDIAELAGLPSGGVVAELARDWLAGLHAASAATADSYCSGLRTWLEWCASERLDPILARPRQVSRFVEYLASTKSGSTGRVRTPRAINGTLTACARWTKWLLLNEDRPAGAGNPFLMVDRPRAVRLRQPLMIDAGDVNRMAVAAYQDHVLGGALGALLVGLLAWEGMRATDITRTDRDQVDERVINRNGEKQRVYLLVARMKWHHVQDRYLPPKLSNLLFAYLQRERRSLWPEHEDGTDPLCVHPRHGRRVNRDDVLALVKRAARHAGLSHWRELTTRDLRRWSLTMSGELGAPLEDRQRAAGHASPAVIQQHYDGAGWSWQRDPAFRLEGVFDDFPADTRVWSLARAMPEVRPPGGPGYECTCTPQWAQARVWLGPVGIDEYARVEVSAVGEPGTSALDPPVCPACRARYTGPFRVVSVPADRDDGLLARVREWLATR